MERRRRWILSGKVQLGILGYIWLNSLHTDFNTGVAEPTGDQVYEQLSTFMHI